MWFDEEALKRVGAELDGEASDRKPRTEKDAAKAVRLPLRIDDTIIVRSIEHPAHMARSRILGAMHGEFILITEPTVKVNDRLWAIFDGGYLCAYFKDGILYNFQSRYRRDLINGTVCIEYPKEIEFRRIRRHRRIKVNIETRCTLLNSGEQFPADMADISFAGCRLVFSEGVRMAVGANVSLTFNLPNEALVSEIRALVVRANRLKDLQSTEAGLSFSGPQNEVSKVSNFCEFCMFFEVE
jgi:c-di-GMP-binding flagellar brake protein YcgR